MTKAPLSLDEILKKTKRSNDCMEWVGGYFVNNNGEKTYPTITRYSKHWRGNRLVFYLVNGYINDEKLILHRCGNKKCLNPDHLYEGTDADNGKDRIRLGECGQKKKTNCPAGHSYSGSNLYVHPRTGHRICKECARIRDRLRWPREKK